MRLAKVYKFDPDHNESIPTRADLAAFQDSVAAEVVISQYGGGISA